MPLLLALMLIRLLTPGRMRMLLILLRLLLLMRMLLLLLLIAPMLMARLMESLLSAEAAAEADAHTEERKGGTAMIMVKIARMSHHEECAP